MTSKYFEILDCKAAVVTQAQILYLFNVHVQSWIYLCVQAHECAFACMTLEAQTQLR